MGALPVWSHIAADLNLALGSLRTYINELPEASVFKEAKKQFRLNKEAELVAGLYVIYRDTKITTNQLAKNYGVSLRWLLRKFSKVEGYSELARSRRFMSNNYLFKPNL